MNMRKGKTMKTTKTTRKERIERMNDLTGKIEKCLAELRSMRPGALRNAPRRRVLQERIAALGAEVRQLI